MPLPRPLKMNFLYYIAFLSKNILKNIFSDKKKFSLIYVILKIFSQLKEILIFVRVILNIFSDKKILILIHVIFIVAY